MKRQIILLALCLVGVFVSVSSVTAADIYVNASAPAGGDGSSTNPFQNISAGVNLATDGDTVNIADGTYSGAGNTQLTITKSMTITGQSQTGTIIDAEQNGRIFDITSGITITIQNLTLQNGRSSESGGATLYNLGDLTLNNVTFKDNNAAGTSSGGAICNSGNLIVTGSTFTGNTASCGGAIFNAGTLNVTGSNFTNNNAIYSPGASYYGGGAICNYADLTVIDSNFTENTATNCDGGAINNYGTITSLSGCIFTGNTAGARGSAICNWDSTITSLSNCIFTDNTADSSGTIYNDYWSELTCNNCDFTNNQAMGNAGAIYTSGSSTITDCNFTNNYADSDGGAICSEYASNLIVTGCNFTDNTAEYGYGGAIFTNGDNAVVTDCTFTGNTAGDWGGAIYNNILIVTDCLFTANTAVNGGAILSETDLTVTGSTFANNIATSAGGAIYNNLGTANVNFNRIVGNSLATVYNYNTGEYQGIFNAEYNWWGSNEPDFTSLVLGIVNYDPWLVMTYSADPTTIQQGSNSTLTADFRYDSDGSFHDPALGHLPDGIPVTFTTDLGNVGSKSVVTYTLNGVATATLRGDEAAGEALTTANLDDQTLNVHVSIKASGADEDSDDAEENSTVTTGAATTETVGMQETGAPIVPLALAVLSVLGGLAATRKKQ